MSSRHHIFLRSDPAPRRRLVHWALAAAGLFVTAGASYAGTSRPSPQSTLATSSPAAPVGGSREPTHSELPAGAEPEKAQSGRALYAEFETIDHGAARSARHPGLEAALEDEDENPAWSQAVAGRTRELLRDDKSVIEARCAQTFCRLRITKALGSGLDWPEIDRLLVPVAEGETIFQTEDNGLLTTAYVYFSAADSHLPLGAPEASEDE